VALLTAMRGHRVHRARVHDLTVPLAVLAITTQEKTRFLPNMSHELRTPLNSIIGFSEILPSRGESLGARERKFLGNIHTSGRHLLAIKSLKADSTTAAVPIVIYSQLENRELGLALGAEGYFLEPGDLHRVVDRIAALVRRSRHPAPGPAPTVT
jgi:signal transduction histidine kinase